MDAGTGFSWPIHLLVLYLEVEMAGKPVVEWGGVYVTGGSQL